MARTDRRRDARPDRRADGGRLREAGAGSTYWGGDSGGRWIEVGETERFGKVTLDANGNGSIPFDVFTAWTRFDISEIVVGTNQGATTPPFPTVTVYKGAQSVALGAGASWTGNQVTFRGRIILDACDTLFVNFAGGVVGSVGTARLFAKNYLWR